MMFSNTDGEGREEEGVWRLFDQGGFMDMDKDEIGWFNDDGG